jgi:hypothetical protein
LVGARDSPASATLVFAWLWRVGSQIDGGEREFGIGLPFPSAEFLVGFGACAVCSGVGSVVLIGRGSLVLFCKAGDAGVMLPVVARGARCIA